MVKRLGERIELSTIERGSTHNWHRASTPLKKVPPFMLR